MSGFAANKKVVGRKQRIAVDSDGWLLIVNLTQPTYRTAHMPSSLFMASAGCHWFKHLFADGANGHPRLIEKASYLDIVIKVSVAAINSMASKPCSGAGSSKEPLAG
jgi:hypothetical protein